MGQTQWENIVHCRIAFARTIAVPHPHIIISGLRRWFHSRHSTTTERSFPCFHPSFPNALTFLSKPIDKISRSLLFLATFMLTLGDHFFRREKMRRGRQNSKFAQYPRDSVGGLSSDGQPIFQSIFLETNFLHPRLVGNRIVGPDNFQKLSISGGVLLGRDHR